MGGAEDEESRVGGALIKGGRGTERKWEGNICFPTSTYIYM